MKAYAFLPSQLTQFIGHALETLIANFSCEIDVYVKADYLGKGETSPKYRVVTPKSEVFDANTLTVWECVRFRRDAFFCSLEQALQNLLEQRLVWTKYDPVLVKKERTERGIKLFYSLPASPGCIDNMLYLSQGNAQLELVC